MSFVTKDFTKQNFAIYLQKMALHKYVISPAGNSVDCHRIWEAIYLGTIPIVKKHQAHSAWLNLPILFIDNWSDLNVDMLNASYQSLKSRDTEQAHFEYYQKAILGDRI